jgi:hypothetical protein
MATAMAKTNDDSHLKCSIHPQLTTVVKKKTGKGLLPLPVFSFFTCGGSGGTKIPRPSPLKGAQQFQVQALEQEQNPSILLWTHYQGPECPMLWRDHKWVAKVNKQPECWTHDQFQLVYFHLDENQISHHQE